jgi:RNA polymerase sigma-70 factor (ECF subfamily)
MGLAAPESNGKSERTEALYLEHGAAVAAFCRSRLRDRSDAEDATQQVFLSAHRALLNGTVPREPLAWLLAVARHECYARFRQRATAPLPTGEAPEGATPDASVHAVRAGELASMWDEVERMPAAQRNAFLLREIRGLSYGQLASELSLSPPSVRSLLLRARTRLRSRLGDVAAGLGGVQWVQTLLRLAGGGDGTSPVPAATKALAVGVGALALAGGSDVPRPVHQTSSVPARPAAHHRSAAHKRRATATPVAVATDRRGDRPRLEDADRQRSRGRDGGDDRSSHSHSRSVGPGSDESGDDSTVTASSPSAETSGDDGGSGSSTTTTTATVTQPTTSSDGGSSGSSSGSDGGRPGPSSTTTSSGSDGGPGPDSSSSSGTDGGGGGSDGGSSGGSGADG